MIDGMMIYGRRFDKTSPLSALLRACVLVCVTPQPKYCLQNNASECLARADVTKEISVR